MGSVNWPRGSDKLNRYQHLQNIISFLNPFIKQSCFNPVPNNKILDLSLFKAFAYDKINVTQKLKFEMGRVENMVGKGENSGYQHFLLFPQHFQKALLLRVGKSLDCVVMT